MPLQHTLLVVGGNGFLGSAISKHALSQGWKVVSISSSGKPYLSPAGHRPAWSSSPNISWHAADALDPSSYAHLAAQCTAAVHTVGILLEADYKPKDKGLAAALPGALAGLAKGWRLPAPSSRNPLQDGPSLSFSADAGKRRQPSYELMNRDSAVSVAHTFLSTLQQRHSTTTTAPSFPSSSSSSFLASSHAYPPPSAPAPFVYISAEDLFRPIVDARYITTKRQAEHIISRLSQHYGRTALKPTAPSDIAAAHGTAAQPAELLDADGAGLELELEQEAAAAASPDDTTALLRPIFMRPGLMYEPHKRPLSTLPAAILEASAAFHKSPPLPLPLPTPASLLASPYAPASLRPLAKLLTTPPLHIDTVAKAVCKAIEDESISGPLDPFQIRKLAGWKDEGAAAAAPVNVAGMDPAHLVHPSHRPGAPDPAAELAAAKKLHPSNPFAATTQPHHRRFSSVGATRSMLDSYPAGRSVAVSRRTFFGLPDLGKLAANTISAATQLGRTASSKDGRSYTDEYGHQVYEAHKVLHLATPLLYRVVSDVDAYQCFLPYCQTSRVLGDSPRFASAASRGGAAEDGADRAVLADLSVGFGSFSETYTSEVRMKTNEWVLAEARQPNPIFQHLSTMWSFSPSPSDTDKGTEVRFKLCYSFRNPVYAAVASGMFENMSAQMMHAFEKRAREVAPTHLRR